jgi:hypothetical protein
MMTPAAVAAMSATPTAVASAASHPHSPVSSATAHPTVPTSVLRLIDQRGRIDLVAGML